MAAGPSLKPPARTILESLAARASSHWPLKTKMTVGLTLFFCAPYFALQHLALFEAREFDLIWIDRWAGFQPAWVWVYQSAYLLMPAAGWFSVSREHLRRYARGFVLLSLVGFSFFALYPVACPRPEVVPASGMFSLLVAYDGRRNAFPSLHCALAAYSVLFGHQSIGPELPRPTRVGLTLVAALWVAAIAYSTLATKQHYALDVAAGLALAWSCHWFAWKHERRL
jgi:membrane-associated phospholipid phosphatase